MKETIRSYVSERVPGERLGDDTPIFSSGMIDSFGVLEMISFLEEKFGVEIDTMKHELTEFDTVNRIEALVTSLKGR